MKEKTTFESKDSDKQKLSFKHECGIVDGIYISSGSGSPLVVIINGHNGFYNYGMFPYIQEGLFRNDISTYSFNFSHGGIIGNSDYFEDLEKYEKNCMRLETTDLLCVLNNLKTNQFGSHPKVVLFAHSLGGVPTIFGAKKAQDEQIQIDGIILVSTVKMLNFWPKPMIEEWTRKKVYYMKNNRTKQELPQGYEFLEEVLNSHTTWNLEREVKALKQPILIIHGEKDESVPMEHSESIFAWTKETNPNSSLKIIANATHTFNTKHPFDGPSIQLEELIKLTADWVRKL